MYIISLVIIVVISIIEGKTDNNICRYIYNNDLITADCSWDTTQTSIQQIPEIEKFDIQGIDMTGQRMHMLEKNTLDGSFYPEIREIMFKECAIRWIDENSMIDLHKLELLDLSDNMLSTLRDGIFSGTLYLKFIYLNNNNIKEIHSNVFKQLNYVEEISLRNNKILTINMGVFPNKLNYNLDLSKNDIADFDKPSEKIGVCLIYLQNNPSSCNHLKSKTNYFANTTCEDNQTTVFSETTGSSQTYHLKFHILIIITFVCILIL